jgi:hypothetical protein
MPTESIYYEQARELALLCADGSHPFRVGVAAIISALEAAYRAGERRGSSKVSAIRPAKALVSVATTKRRRA